MEFKIGQKVHVDRYGRGFELGGIVDLVPFAFGDEVDAYKIRLDDKEIVNKSEYYGRYKIRGNTIVCRPQSIVESEYYIPIPLEDKFGNN